MSILDDLAICEQRALLLLQTMLRSTKTPSEDQGRRKHRLLLRRILSKLESLLESELNLKILESCVECSVKGDLLVITYNCAHGSLVLRGRPDILVLTSDLYIVSLEYANYRTAPKTIATRHALYAAALYDAYGFPVIPTLLVEAGNTFETLILWKKPWWNKEVKKKLDRFAEIVFGKSTPRGPNSVEVCASCPPSIRGLCPLVGRP